MTGFATNIESARRYYAEIGFDTLPLSPGSKQACVKGWQSRSPLELWSEAAENSNIGIRCGGAINLALIDCDETTLEGTFTKAVQFMAGLGLNPGSYPVVQTASGNGRHIYMRLESPLKGNWKSLNPNLGAGEFRFGPGAYVVAPPSVIQSPYSLISGSFDTLPTLNPNDILTIIQGKLESVKDLKKPETHQKIPRLAWRLLNGDIPGYYPSRSEAEQAIITSLVNSGFEFEHILNLFYKYPGAGKFKEKYNHNPKKAIGYLMHSHCKAVRWTRDNISSGRQRAQAAIEWALSKSWPGRMGAYDRKIFLAHAQIAWKCGKLVYAASARNLAERANISHVAALNATQRLIKQNLIKLEEKAVANLASKYSLRGKQAGQESHISGCQGNSLSHDVFCYQGLGKSSELIWEYLQQGPKTLDELIKQTGKTKPTVKKWLGIMSKLVDFRTGEIHSMVSFESGVWVANNKINLDFIAELLGVSGIRERRKRAHEHQRDIHNRALAWGRISGGSANM